MTAATVRLRVLSAPTMTVRRSTLVAGSADDTEVRIPLPVFLIEHPDGIVLFDAGLAPEASVDPGQVYGERAHRLGLEYTPEQRVDRRLAASGLRCADIGTVIVSHLHFDHAGSVPLFPEARIVVGAGELEHAASGADRYCRPQDVADVAARDPLRVEHELDLFGDGTVVILPLPGHTPGHLGLLVRTTGRVCILAADAVHSRDALHSLAPFPHDADPELAVASIRRLTERATSADADIWVSHDPGGRPAPLS